MCVLRAHSSRPPQAWHYSRCSINSSNEEEGMRGCKTQPFILLTVKTPGQEFSVLNAHYNTLKTLGPGTHTPEILT